MKMNERMKKVLSFLLCVLMLVQQVPFYAFAAATAEDNLCAHHTEHTEECGYVEGAGACTYHCDVCLGHDHEDEAAEDTAEPVEDAPVCDCGTDDESIHATTCAVYVAPENPVCCCAGKCSEPNIWCDVCGFDYTQCGGTDTAAAYASGTCGAQGDNLTWTLEDGTLTISGTGAMADYTYYDDSPWYGNRQTITSLSIQEGVTTIGRAAFFNIAGLTSVTIPASVTKLGGLSFVSSGLKTVTFAEGSQLTTIDDYAFQNCTALTEITLPAGVTDLSPRVFLGCALTDIHVAVGSSAYKSVDGVLYTADGTTLVLYPAGKTAESFTIPASVTTIGDSAFSNCAALETVTIPASVTSIGEEAFLFCTALETVTIPASVTSIGLDAFYGCDALTTVNVPCTWDGSLYTFDDGVEVNNVHTGTATYTILDGTQHTAKWSCCDTTVTEAHSGGMATCTKQANCEYCNASYSAPDNHTAEPAYTLTDGGSQHIATYSCCNTTVTEAHTGGTATCTAQAVCQKCGESYGDKNADNHTGTLGTPEPTDGGTQHTAKWSCCDTTVTEAHTGGTATCTARAVCQKCGESYGELGDHNWANGVCTNKCGIEHSPHVWYNSVCSTCGYVCTHKTYTNGFCVCGVYQPCAGSGTSGSPYLIANAGNLYWFSAVVNGGYGDVAQNRSAHAKLTADIEVNPGTFDAAGNYTPKDGETLRNWTLIGDYTNYYVYNRYIGTFDGDGHTISGLYFNNSSIKGVGLFGYVGEGGTVRNVGIVDSYFRGDSYVGGVVGYNEYGTVTNCYNTGIVRGRYAVGGLVGYNFNGTVANCYNTGSVSVSSYNVGGVVGYDYKGNGTITNCYYLAGCAKDGDSTTQNGIGASYKGGTTADTAGRTTVKTEAQFASGEVAYLLNGSASDGVWKQNIDLEGVTPDAVPSFTGGTVYRVTCVGIPMDLYSNTDTNYEAHDFADKVCTRCGVPDMAIDESGAYLIYTAEDWMLFANYVNNGGTTANAKLMADIDLTATGNVMIGTSSAQYSGIFDGGDHTVKNLSVTAASSYAGLFGNVSGTVKNLTVYGNITVTESSVVNIGVIGYLTGTAEGIHSYVNISVTEGVTGTKYLGGVVGQLNGGTVRKSAYYGRITLSSASVDQTGGIVGYVNASNTPAITDCGFYGTITTTNEANSVGGILGYANNGNLTLTNCLSVGTLPTSGSNVTAFGTLNSTPKSISGLYYLEDSAPNATAGSATIAEGRVTAVTSTQLASGEVTYLLNGEKTDGTQVWYQTCGVGLPAFTGETVYYFYADCQSAEKTYSNSAVGFTTINDHGYDSNGFCANTLVGGATCNAFQPCEGAGTEGDPYKISNAGNLYWFAAVVNGGYGDVAQNKSAHGKLTAKIVVNTGVLVNGELASDTGDFREWTPIGNNSKKYTGTFDGAEHTISGLYFDNSTTDYVGLFGCVGSGGKVQNVGVIDSYFYGNNYVGSVVGYNYGTVENCYNTGIVSGKSYYVGGVVGINHEGTVKNCYNTGSVSSYGMVGGVVGRVYSGTVTNCYYLTGCAKDGNSTTQNGIGVSSLGSTTADTEGVTTGKSETEFASGEVAYLLGSAWGQTIGNEDYPVLGGAQVYYGYVDCQATGAIYSNTAVSSQQNAHKYENGICVNTLANGATCGVACKHETYENGVCTACGAVCGHKAYTNGACTVCGTPCEHSGGYENGICIVCGEYEPCTGEGTVNSPYQIGNAGQLMWFAAVVNSGYGDVKQNTSANAILAADIDLKGLAWTPIGNSSNNFAGSFNGQGHSITDLTVSSSGTASTGLFGVTSRATITSFSVSGTITICDTQSKDTETGTGVVGIASNGTEISKVHSALDIVVKSGVTYVRFAGGVVGELKASTVTECSYSGTIDLGGTTVDQVGGIVGYVLNSGNASLTNCGFYGTITTTNTENSIGGILGYSRNSSLTLTNCLSVGTLPTSGSNVTAFGTLNAAPKRISGLYYKEGSAPKATAGDATIAESRVTAVSATQLASGEVAWLLNGSDSDGVWKQTAGTGLPGLSGKTVYQYYACDGETVQYTNDSTLSGKTAAHSFPAGSNTCTACGKTCGVTFPHSGGTATCQEQATCELCGLKYGYNNYSNHVGPYEPKFYWEEPDEEVSAMLYCACGIDVELARGTAELSELVEAKDCLNPGTATYSITLTLQGAEYTDTKTFTVESEKHTKLDSDGFCSACGGYQPCEGAGTSESPYQIGNAGQLFWFADYINNVKNEAYAIVTTDITIPAGKTWTPILNFYGTFDGNFKTVSGLVVESDGDYVGMFGGGYYSSGTIKNLHLTNSKFIGKSYVGGIAGQHAGTIRNCYVDDTVSVSGTSHYGALVGYNDGTVENCFAYASTAIGYNSSGYGATVTNVYYLSDSDTDGMDGTTAKTAAQFESGEVAYLLNSSSSEGVWKQTLGEDGDDYPNFTGGTVYHVTNCIDKTFYSNSTETHDWKDGVCLNGCSTVHSPHDCNAEGKCSVCGAGIAATVKMGGVTTGYTTLADAINAAEASSSNDRADVTLWADYSGGDISIDSGDITLDLNGKTIENEGTWGRAVSVQSGAALTITGTGSISATGQGSYGVFNSGTVEISGEAEISGTGCGVYNYGGTVTITGGTVSGTTYGVFNSGALTISGGTISATGEDGRGVQNDGGTVKISGKASVSGTSYGVHNWNGGEVNITGGTVSDTNTGVHNDGGTVKISGEAEISGTGYGVYNYGGAVTITGGTVSATGEDGYGVKNDSGTVEISGGTVSGTKYGVTNSGNTLTISGNASVSGGSADYAYGGGTIDLSAANIPAEGWTVMNMSMNGSSAAIGDFLTLPAGYIVTAGNGPLTALAWGETATILDHPSAHNYNADGKCSICGAGLAATVKMGGVTTDYATLADAINAAEAGTSGQPAVVTLRADYSGAPISIDSGCITLELNDKTIKNEAGTAVLVQSGAVLTITGTGSISGTGQGSYGVENSGTLTINGGTVSATGERGFGVYNSNGGTVEISGGTVRGTSYGVYNSGEGSKVTITGGTVRATGEDGCGVDNRDGGTVEISGGEVSATGERGCGVYNSGSTVEISGGSVSGTGENGCGVYNSSGGTVTISGGEVSATGENSRGVDNRDGGTVEISGDAEISGTYHGVYNISGTVEISGDAEISGTDYGVENRGTVTIEGGTVSGTTYGVYNIGGTVTISGGEVSATGENSRGVYNISGTVEISGGSVSGTYCGVYNYGSGKVTISGGTVEISGANYGVYNTGGGTLTITGGSVSGTGENSYGVYNSSSDTVEISGEASISGKNCGVMNFGTVTISGGTVSGTNYGVYNSGGGTLTISGGSVSGTSDYSFGVYNEGDGSTVEISGQVTIQGSTADFARYYDSSCRFDLSSATIPAEGWTVRIESYDGEEVSEGTSIAISNFLTLPADYIVTAGSGPLTALAVGETGTIMQHSASAHDCNAEGKCSVCGAEIVATVAMGGVTTHYTTLAEAINAAEAGSSDNFAVVTLRADYSGAPISIDSGCITLELNDKTIKNETGTAVFVQSGAVLTITGTGSISGTSYGVENSGTLTIKGGSVSGANYGVFNDGGIVNITGGSVSGTAGVFNSNGGKVNISGEASVSGTSSGTNYGVYNAAGTVTISGGTVSGRDGVRNEGGTVTIKGGTVSGASYGVSNSNGKVIISGGTVSATGESGYGVTSSGKGSEVTISGEASVSGTERGVNNYSGTVTITSGTVSATCDDSYGVINNGGTVTITDGSISGNTGVFSSNGGTVKISGKASVSGTEYGLNNSAGTLTISGGTVSATGEGSYGVRNSSGGEVTITGGSISGNSGVLNEGGTVSIEGGSISATGNYGYGVYNSGEGSKVTISDGTVSATGETSYGVYNSSGTVEISSGSVSGTYYGVRNSNGGKVTITGTGSISGGTGESSYGVFNEGGIVNITGGTVSGNTGVDNSNGGKVTITGTGSISGTGDYSYGVENSNGGKVTISGTGSISGTNYGVYNYGGTVTITGGTVSATGDYSYGVFNSGGGSKVTITGGSVSGTYCGVHNYGGTVEISGEASISGKNCSVMNSGTLTISGGTIRATDTGVRNEGGTLTITGGSISGNYGVNNAGGTMTIEGGSISGNRYGAQNSSGKMTISGGTVSGTESGVFNWDADNGVEIIGGTVSGTTGVDNYGGTVTIKGGTVSGTDYGVYNDDGTVTISGQVTIEGNTADFARYYYWPSSFDLSGATIPAEGWTVRIDSLGDEVPEAIAIGDFLTLPDDCIVTVDGTKVTELAVDVTATIMKHSASAHDCNAEGKCSVCGAEIVATVAMGGVTIGYTTLAEAITAAEASSSKQPAVVTLRADYSGGDINIDSGHITLDLNGKTIENTANMFGRAVLVQSGAALTITGTGSISATGLFSSGVYNEGGTVEISGGTVSATGNYSDGVYNGGGTVTISGGTGSIIGTNYGVNNYGGTVEISSGTVSGNTGVHNSNGGKVTITGTGSIIGTNYGVNNYSGTVTIEGGTVSGNKYGVYNYGEGSKVTVSGQVTIEGGAADFARYYNYSSSFDLSSATIPEEGWTVRIESEGNKEAAVTSIAIGDFLTLPDDCIVTVDGTKVTELAVDVTATIMQHSASAHDCNADGKCSICGAEIVASVTMGVVTTYYTTLAEAITAAEASSSGNLAVVDLRANYSGDPISIDSGCITLELNGKTIKNETGTAVFVQSGAALTITGTGSISGTNYGVYNYGGTVSIEGGTVSATDDYGYGVWNDGGTLTITGGSVSGTGDYGYGVYNEGEGSKVTISGGSVSATGEGGNGVWNDGGTVSIEGGTVSATGDYGYGVYNNGEGSKVTISGGTVSAINYGVENYDGEVTINGGTVSATGEGGNGVVNFGTLTISGKASVSATGNGGTGVYNRNGGTVTISGGTVSGRTGDGDDYGNGVENNGGTVNIIGGTISGSTGVDNDGGKVTIDDDASISDTSYGVYNRNGGTVEISGGSVSATKYGVENYGGEVTISGGSISSSDGGVYNYGGGTVTITGGTITGIGEGVDGVGIYDGTLNISGGTISGTENGVENGYKGIVTITGGTITGGVYGVYNRVGGTATVIGQVTIEGGAADFARYYNYSSSFDLTDATIPAEGWTVRIESYDDEVPEVTSIAIGDFLTLPDDCIVTVDGTKVTELAVDATGTITKASEDPTIISVNISWGGMTFTYTEDGGWTDDGSGWVAVENTGSTDVSVAYDYVTTRTDISGEFSDGTETVTEVAIIPNDSKKVWLILTGTPGKALSSTVIGTVKLTIE